MAWKKESHVSVFTSLLLDKFEKSQRTRAHLLFKALVSYTGSDHQPISSSESLQMHNEKLKHLKNLIRGTACHWDVTVTFKWKLIYIFFIVHTRNIGPAFKRIKKSVFDTCNVTNSAAIYKQVIYVMYGRTTLLVIKFGNKTKIRMLKEYLLPQPLKHLMTSQY